MTSRQSDKEMEWIWDRVTKKSNNKEEYQTDKLVKVAKRQSGKKREWQVGIVTKKGRDKEKKSRRDSVT